MAFNVTGLTNYTKPNEKTLLVKAFVEPKTASLLSKMTGVKSAEQVPNLTDVAFWQAGGSCGLINASGDTTISARTLTVGRVKIEKQWCIADLEAKYTQLLLSPGSNYTDLPGGIDQAVVESILGGIGEQAEQAIWQGDTTVWQDYLNKFDGLIKIIAAASGVIQANATPFISAPVTAITTSNVISVFQAVALAIPTALLNKGDLKVFCGIDVARLYQVALTNANLFHYQSIDSATGEYTLHGTNIKIVPVFGLNGTNKIYAGQLSNIFLGVDMENEEEELKFWYSEDYDSVNMRIKFKMGVQIGKPTEIVRFTF